MKSQLAFAVAGMVLSTVLTSASAQAATLDDVKSKGFVQCGVSQGLPGFSNPDDKGEWRGLDVDLCRALAAAVLGDAKKVKFTPLSSKERFTALTSGEIDVLVRNTTWTMNRDTTLGVNFTGVNYYDGQGLMVHAELQKKLDIKSGKDLDGATVCIETGTTTELNITDFFKANGMTFEPLAFQRADEVVTAYDVGRCDVYTTDRSALAAQRLKMKDPAAHVILPDILSKEPLGGVVRQGDDQWFNIVKWVHNAMLNAEELGVSSKNVAAKVDEIGKHLAAKELGSVDPKVARLLGLQGSFGEGIGLKNDWVVNILSQVGNYAEVFDRNVGPATPLKLERGYNALWSKGGLQYAPPIR